ncbi:PIN/TRAM domain-containing protein [Luteolibacter soli]|uniref:PIN/TRAM domain-containing protein n=1 Tax=Luteolibacter soli TaxID=3135280 RepID=A0ABU9B2Y3_9BACT
MAPASVNIARVLYLLVCAGAGYAVATITKGTALEVSTFQGLCGGLFLGGIFVWLELLIKRFSLRAFSTATFGLLIGVFCAWLLTRLQVFDLVNITLRARLSAAEGNPDIGADVASTLALSLNLLLYATLGFLGSVVALRSSRDDFAFIIPYVRFRQDSSTGQPVVLDAESIMDARIPAVVRSGFLSGRLVVPRFVLDEIQVLANSPTPAKRQRAERGLACLDQMRGGKDMQVSIEDTAGVSADETMTGRLLQVAQLLGARLLSTDENLCKVAKLRGVEVLNLDELLDALRPSVTVGEKVRLALVRGGKDEHQGVGYLPDGTMIVVNHASPKIGTTQDVVVISTLQTSGGQILFAELAGA